MHRRHGTADPLLPGNVNFDEIDRIIDADGGTEQSAMRLLLANDFLGPKRFGRMFPHAARFRPPAEILIELGAALAELDTIDPKADPARDSRIPAGFTYLGQFVDHDITFDPTIGFPPVEDPEDLESRRTPRLDLDSVYGLGPQASSELYVDPVDPALARFRIGLTVRSPEDPASDRELPNDLPRKKDGSKEAIIGDPRNDENLVIAQLHLQFLKLHNKLMDTPPEAVNGETPFETARRLVRWHYQWIVLHDFLPRIIDPDVLATVLRDGRRFYDFEQPPFNGVPFMPVEFSVAAYRLGHSMVRNSYNFNRRFSTDPGALATGTLSLLFVFTGAGGFGGDDRLPSRWIIDWRRFFKVGDRALLNLARKFDSKLAFALRRVFDVGPQEPVSLASRNLLRSRLVGLPTGQDVAEAIGAQPLTPGDLGSGDEVDIVQAHEFDQRTPLWFYILKEAEVQADGQRLGEVGSRILAEVFVGMLQGDPNSFLAAQPDWVPTLPAETPGSFTMADLLHFVGDINPIGPDNPET